LTQSSAKQPSNHTDVGLTSDEARRRLEKFGANAMPDVTLHPLRMALEKFWAPVPWMLEAAILLQVGLGKYVEAAIIAALLVFNAALGFFQEGRAQATLAALKSRLALTASVRRDGAWKEIPAAELAPGDVVKLSLGGVVAADARLTEGEVLLDQSMLTGESVPIEAGPGAKTYSGALVRRGEAVAEVTATGTRTKFGRTAELVRTAHVVSSQQKAVLHVVRNLALFNGVVIVALVAYAYFLKMPFDEIIPLVLTAVLASIPVALPATFTLAAALGASALAKVGVLPTRLSAVDEAAMMDVLCADKTGTLTRNELSVTNTYPMSGFDAAHVLALAALASSDGGQEPVDAAIRAAAETSSISDTPKLVSFTPFDPAKKLSEATATDSSGNALHIVKGAFDVVIGLSQSSPSATTAAKTFEEQGFRVLAVAAGPPSAMKLVGLIALSDPPNPDSAAFITELRELGVRTVMVTGDAPATAKIVAHAVGLDGAICPPGPIPEGVRPEAFAVFAGVLPEDKYKLVKAFQLGGHVVGMCGDGANDAPALRQAQIGIAVSTATDVAKSAAGVVLTEPGLAGIVAAVKEGRTTFERILSYTLNSITKKTVQVLFLGVGLIMTGHAILTPLLMVLIMIAGDFLGMSLTTDNVRPSSLPNAWRIGDLTIAGVAMGIGELVFCVSVLAFGAYQMELDIDALRTLAFVAIVFGNQATLYTNRERRRLWSSRPSFWLIASSVADVSIASTLAVGGIAMTPLSFVVVVGALASAIAFAVILDLIKVPIFRRLKLGSPISRKLPSPNIAPTSRRPTTAKYGIEIGTRRLKPLLLFLGLVIAAGGAGYEFRDRFKTTPPIGIISANGRIEANESDITTKVPGRVAELLVDEGSVVTAGQILAHIDTKDRDALRDRDATGVSGLQKIIGEDEVFFARTSFELRRAKLHLAHARGLLREGRGTRKMLARRQQETYSAAAALTAAKARLGEDGLKLDVAKHALEQAQVNIADSALVAPIGGRIQRRTARAGETLPLGAKVFVMLDTTSIYMDILLPAAAARKVKLGSDARVILDALPSLSIPAKVSILVNGPQSGPINAESKSQRKAPMVPVRELIDPAHLGAAAAIVRIGMPGVVHIRLDP
jgi:H+-transporting ATPase